ncbi:uncharacterized protein F5891DRAFT_984474 [Suillus fuscotomentosus]|uniref:Uncharacterized protein n=1 Tax=Suillus fuscotomentosus TaxID=1912939 RepID=A0AAD4HFY9_9AGAM|nr:uncharacterized protein F5891DRAFT_984474 [Suillus fuscotomentosus]KAG1895153.1 hypothetical protein F5891DRAFT_984474 [Suillus fuscotomentosus]
MRLEVVFTKPTQQDRVIPISDDEFSHFEDALQVQITSTLHEALISWLAKQLNLTFLITFHANNRLVHRESQTCAHATVENGNASFASPLDETHLHRLEQDTVDDLDFITLELGERRRWDQKKLRIETTNLEIFARNTAGSVAVDSLLVLRDDTRKALSPSSPDAARCRHETLRKVMAPRRKFLKTREKNFDSLIPRPRGAAKRDFALQDEMRLHGEDATYNSIQASELPSRSTFVHSYQRIISSPLVLASITKKAMSRIPYLAKFEHGWPVKELIQQYLQNHCDYVKRKGRDKSKPKSRKAAAGRTKQPVPADFGESQESGENTEDARKCQPEGNTIVPYPSSNTSHSESTESDLDDSSSFLHETESSQDISHWQAQDASEHSPNEEEFRATSPVSELTMEEIQAEWKPVFRKRARDW